MDEPVRIPSLPDLNKSALSAQTSLEEELPAWRRPGSLRNKNTNEQPSKNLTLSKTYLYLFLLIVNYYFK